MNLNEWGDDPETGIATPANIVVAMVTGATPLLRAIRAIGPHRVRWIDGPAPNSNDKSQARSLTCWALDGARATHAELMAAGGKS